MKIDAETHSKILIGFIASVAVVAVAKMVFTEKVIVDGKIVTKYKKPNLKKFSPMAKNAPADKKAA
jgi:hypothetical protein